MPISHGYSWRRNGLQNTNVPITEVAPLLLQQYYYVLWAKIFFPLIKIILEGLQLVFILNNIVDCLFHRLYWVATPAKVLPLLTKWQFLAP